MLILKLHLKSAVRFLPLLILVALCQLVLGRMSSAAMSERAVEMKLAVSVEESGELCEAYIMALEGIAELELVHVEAGTQIQEIFEDRSLMGALVIPDYFADYVVGGKPQAALFYPAPGVADTAEIEEYLMTELVILRTQVLLEKALQSLGAPLENATEDSAVWEPILTLSYDGPVGQQPFSDLSLFGLPALLLLLSFLHSASASSGPDKKRAVMRGNEAVLRDFLAGQIAMLIVWSMVMVIYLLGMRIIYEVRVELLTAAALFALVFYAVSLGGLLAMTGKRIWAAWIFAPLFLLNMTIGGGLWDNGVRTLLLAPLLPVSQVLAAADGSRAGAVSLLGCAAVCLSVSMIMPRLLSRKGLRDF